jgi:hypothetical protein
MQGPCHRAPGRIVMRPHPVLILSPEGEDMSTTSVASPLSRPRLGLARVEITPPVGIYHRLWGAARHDRATGVHRPLYGDLLAIGPVDGGPPSLLRVQLDLCGLVQEQHDAVRQAVADGAGLALDRVVLSHSHTHSSGWFIPDRLPLPGGELIPGYLADLNERLRAAAPRAVAAMRPVLITYGVGRCAMAANRDYWDEQNQLYACGYNPDAPADDTVLVGRVTDDGGGLVATLVHYACHPTTLAWDNALISPDYIGAARETVERATGAPCIPFQGMCGDLGPRRGYVGDTAVADQNGRELGYAALAALTGLGPPATSLDYAGPVVSGATLGTWADRPVGEDRLAAAATLAGGCFTVDLPLRRIDAAEQRALLSEWEARQREADAAGDTVAARDAGARAERARRWLARLADLPPGDSYPLRFSVHRLGEALWITCGGEPYNVLQRELRRRFPDQAILCSPVSGDLQVAYLLPRDRYGLGLYQEEPSSLAPGCLEALTEAISARVAALLA